MKTQYDSDDVQEGVTEELLKLFESHVFVMMGINGIGIKKKK